MDDYACLFYFFPHNQDYLQMKKHLMQTFHTLKGLYVYIV